ncbi:porin [Cupriavidus necator]
MNIQFRFRSTRVATLTFVAGTLLAGSAIAQSSVTLYGQVDSYIGTSRAPGSDRSYILGGGGMQTSYWGIKGTEDLGGGMKAIFDLNAFYRVDTGKGGSYDGEPFFARNAFMGMEHSSYGSVRLGPILFTSQPLWGRFADSAARIAAGFGNSTSFVSRRGDCACRGFAPRGRWRVRAADFVSSFATAQGEIAAASGRRRLSTRTA